MLLHVIEERPYGLSRLCAGLQLRLPVYPHLPLRCFPVATGLEDDEVGWNGWMTKVTCAMTWIKVRKSCASSTSLSRPRPSGSSSRTRSRRLETESDAVDDQDVYCVLSCSLRSTTHCWESPFCPLNQLVVSSAQSAESSLHMLR